MKDSWTDKIEETLIAIILGAMTLVTFANVIARFVFNSNILWALELTVFMFAWLVLLGSSYAVKKRAHLGVDAVINMVAPETRRILGLISVGLCIIFSLLMLKGAWDYFAPFANLSPTSGRWIPTGFEQVRGQGWYETQDIPVPFFLTWLEGAFNDGDEYEKIPKLVPYIVLPISMALLLIRFIQAGIALWRGEIESVIASHEAEEALEEAAANLKD